LKRSTWKDLRPYSHISDSDEKGCQRQALYLLWALRQWQSRYDFELKDCPIVFHGVRGESHFSRNPHSPICLKDLPGNPYWKKRISTADLLVLTCFVQFIFILAKKYLPLLWKS
jgi:hypothetical protein